MNGRDGRPANASSSLDASAVDVGAFLKELQPQLEATLKKRFRAVRADHDDLVSETLSGVAAWARRSPPASTADLRQVAWAIFNRRVADFFRKQLPAPQELDGDADEPPPALHPAGAEEHRLDLTRLFFMMNAVLKAMPAEDVDLLVVGSQMALSDRDRQRLHRARERLAGEIHRRFGVAPRHLLGDG